MKSNPKLRDLSRISILFVLSKVLERVAEKQLGTHIDDCNIPPFNQLGFRPHHSCATALSKVTDDIFSALDAGNVIVLVLLDFSKAFETVNHKILRSLLHYIGLSELAVSFFRQYLSDIRFRVALEGSLSDGVLVNVGVPHGSILGPIPFTIYTSGLLDSLGTCKFHMYAHDAQLYHAFTLRDLDDAVDGINNNLNVLLQKALEHTLLINPDKSAVIAFGCKSDNVLKRIKIEIGDVDVALVGEARNLGVMFDTDLRFRPHICKCIQRAFSALRLLYSHKSYLDVQTKTLLCNSLVLSHFQDCLPVLAPCIDSRDRKRMQLVQNA